MERDPVFSDFDIYVYEYPTKLFGDCLPITDLANNMRLHLKNSNVFEDHEQIIFLAHSMGGLLVRQFLLRNRDIAQKVPLVFFFATPTAGSALANVGSTLSQCSQVSDLRTLDVNSYLGGQQSDWLSSGLQERVISYCAFETKSTVGTTLVNRSSATLLCTKDPDALPTDHVDTVKPRGPDDLSHMIVRTAIKDLPSPEIKNLDIGDQNQELRKQVGDLKDRLEQRFRKRAIREQLGRFILEGSDLDQITRKRPPAPPPDKEADAWFQNVRRYLREMLDSSYEARFISPESGPSYSHGVPKEYNDLIEGLRIRLAALHKFLDELKD
jgi:hypothetical protein